MASPVYVWHGSSQDDADGTWNSATIAYLTLELALAAVDAGGIIYIASEHSQTSGAGDLALTSTNGTLALPVTTISVDKDNSDAYRRMDDDTGKIELTGLAAFQFEGFDIFVGLYWDTTEDNFEVLKTSDRSQKFFDCKIVIDRNLLTATGLDNDAAVLFDGCNIIFDGVNSNFTIGGGVVTILGGTIECTGTVSSYLFNLSSNNRVAKLFVSDVTITGIDGDDSLVRGGRDAGDTVIFKRCKIPAGIAGLLSADPVGDTGSFKFHSVSNSDIIYQFQENYYEGQINEDTGIYLDATYDGANGYSAKMVSLATAIEWVRPLRFKLAEIWVAATGKVLTVELMTDNVTLQNDEFWIEVEYPDSITRALGNILSTRMTNITDSPANLTASGKGAGDWTGEGGLGTPVYQKVAADFTGVADEAIGVYTVWACLAKPSTVVYVCPKIVVN